jgi:cytochrome oxidase assembly protein ShyY1
VWLRPIELNDVEMPLSTPAISLSGVCEEEEEEEEDDSQRVSLTGVFLLMVCWVMYGVNE